MSDKSSDNIQAGFRASGLIPLDREQILKRLPKQSAEGENENSQEWVSSFKEFLQESRKKEPQPLKTRKSRLNLLPGKGIDESMLQTSTQPGPSGHKQQRKKKTQVMSESDDSTITLHDESDDGGDMSQFLPSNVEENIFSQINIPDNSDESMADDFIENIDPLLETEVNASNVPEVNATNFPDGSFVVVNFFYNSDSKKPTEKRFVGTVILTVGKDEMDVKFMRKSTKTEDTFVFPAVEDLQTVTLDQVITEIKPVKISRGRYVFPKEVREYKCS